MSVKLFTYHPVAISEGKLNFALQCKSSINVLARALYVNERLQASLENCVSCLQVRHGRVLSEEDT